MIFHPHMKSMSNSNGRVHGPQESTLVKKRYAFYNLFTFLTGFPEDNQQPT